MKSLSIALKDLKRSFRSAFALIFMFALPLMVTGMFYFMFGNIATGGGFTVPPTKVVIANLDKGDPQIRLVGNEVVETLQSGDFANLMEVSTLAEASAARQRVDAGQAGVAIIIPEDFSASFTNPDAVAEIELYKDPTLTIGPGIVQTILKQLTDAFAGAKITAAVALKQVETGKLEASQIDPIVTAYIDALHASGHSQSLIEQRAPAAAPQKNFLVAMLGPIMAGMMIFFAFFTGVNTANSILKEHEEGTLPRLFTTPTTQAEVLNGKFLAVGLTVAVQIITLLVSARLLFKIDWGSLPTLALAALSIVCSSTAFGILVCSLLKDTRQGGIVFGGVLTVTGMIGMMDIFTGNFEGGQFGIIPLLTPQGWAARSILLSMSGASFNQVLPYALVLLALSLVFLITGVLRFQKRYA